MTEDALLLDLGFRGYKETWKLQLTMVERRASGSLPDALILVEHPHVYTLGRRAPDDMEVPAGVAVHRVERGGDITYHGPGQLVAYPIIKLDERRMDIKAYLRDLEEVAIRTLRKFQIRGERGAQTGVWVGGRKIASIGIALRHWVTFHGLALNADPDLDYFRRIRPCGLEGETITSMVEVLGKGVYLPTVKEEFKHHFQEVFGVHLRPVDEALLGLL